MVIPNYDKKKVFHISSKAAVDPIGGNRRFKVFPKGIPRIHEHNWGTRWGTILHRPVSSLSSYDARQAARFFNLYTASLRLAKSREMVGEFQRRRKRTYVREGAEISFFFLTIPYLSLPRLSAASRTSNTLNIPGSDATTNFTGELRLSLGA